MKTFTFKGHHYIWHPDVLAKNIFKGTTAAAICGFYAWALLTFFMGGPIC